jgi:hypothetical protein
VVKTLGDLYKQYEVTLEEEEAWSMMNKTEMYDDYAAPLLEIKRLLAQYEKLLLERRWTDAVEMAPQLNTQARLLTQTVRLQAERQIL